jgi:hypothetical protein
MTWLRLFSHRLMQITHGRSTAFFIAFFISGNVLAWLHNLTPVYVSFMIGLGGLVLVHSGKEDWAEKLNGARPQGGPDAPDSRPS